MPHYKLMQSVHAWAMFLTANIVKEAMLVKQWDWVYGIRWDIYSID